MWVPGCTWQRSDIVFENAHAKAPNVKPSCWEYEDYVRLPSRRVYIGPQRVAVLAGRLRASLQKVLGFLGFRV